MNPAPLPQPAAFTCPNCGVALDEKPPFCPRCGAQLDAKPRRAALSVGMMFLLALGIMVFGVIGACGGLFVAASFGKQDGELPASAFLVISVPSLLIGLVGFVLCARPFFRRKR